MLEEAQLIAHEADPFRKGRSAYYIRKPLIAFYEAVMRREWTRLERGDPAGAWRNAQATFSAQVVGPHFEYLYRKRALEVGDGTFGDWPATVAAGVVPDPANRTQIQVDVAVLGPEIPGEPPRILSLGEAKWGQVMTSGPRQAASPRPRPARGQGIRHQLDQADLLQRGGIRRGPANRGPPRHPGPAGRP